MKRLVPGWCAWVTAGAFSARVAWGSPPVSEPSVRLAPLDAQTCVAEHELRSALEKAGITVAPADSAPDLSIVRVTVQGTPEHLTVLTAGAGHDDTATLPAATCQTATDLAAAFLISALAPATALPASAGALSRLQAATLDRAIRDELARRGLQLAEFGVLLSVQRDRSDTWFVTILARDEPSITRTIALGNFDDPSPERLAAISDPIVLAVQEVSMRQELAPRSARQVRLQHALEDVEVRTSMATSAGVLELAAGGAGLTLLIPAHAPNAHYSFSDASDAFASVGASLAVLGGTSSFLVDDDYRSSLVTVTGYAALGAAFASLTARDEQSVPRLSVIGLTAGSYSTAIFLGLDAALRRPPVSRLRAARRDLARRAATSAEMDGIERDLAALDPPIPAWVSYSPAMLGGAIATVPAFAHRFAGEGRSDAAFLGVGLFTLGLASAVLPTCYTTYQNAQRKAGVSDLALGPIPGAARGISLSGRF